MNRRQWLRATGASLAGLALAPTSKVSGQPAPSAPAPMPAAPRPAGPARLNYNENPFGPSAAALAAMAASGKTSCYYPIEEQMDLIDLIAAKERVSPDHILLGVGSGEILTTTGIHFGLAKGEIVCADPSYLDLVSAAENFGGRAVKVKLNSRLEHDLPAMEAAVTERTSVVYICNPNNPTGTVVPPAELKAFAKRLSPKAVVFVDEAYLDLGDDFAGSTLAPLVAEGHNIVVARTFSKIYALAGQRIGYGIMKPELVAKLRPYTAGMVTTVSIAAASACLRDPDHVPAMHAKIKAGRDGLVAVLNELGRNYAEPQGNFVFFQTGMPIKLFAQRMKAEGVLVARPFPPLLDWCRISVGLPEDMERCHRALRKIFAS